VHGGIWDGLKTSCKTNWANVEQYVLPFVAGYLGGVHSVDDAARSFGRDQIFDGFQVDEFGVLVI
jgi:hypothetical protein